MYNLVTSWDICNLIEIFKLKIFKEVRMSYNFINTYQIFLLENVHAYNSSSNFNSSLVKLSIIIF